MCIEVKVQTAVSRRLQKFSNNYAMSTSLSAAIATIFTPWLIEMGWVKTNNTKISLTSSAKETLDRLARACRWLENKKYHHGQQVTGFARKALRSILNGHPTCEEVLELCAEFQRLRKKAIDTRALIKPFATPWRVEIGTTGVFARRLTCDSEMSRDGHVMGNCLANAEHRLHYINRARRSEVDLIVVCNKKSKPVVLLSVAENALEEMKGPENCRAWRYRSKLLAFLVLTNVQCGECIDGLEIGVCDELLLAKANGVCETFKDKEHGTVCDVGSGFLAMAEGQYTVLLQSTDSGSDVVATVGTDDGDLAGACQHLQKRLRQLCRHDAELAAACKSAFPDVDVTRRAWHRVIK